MTSIPNALAVAVTVLAGATAFLLLLKAIEMGFQCFIMARISLAHELAYDWVITKALRKLHFNWLFRFPILVVAMSCWLAYEALPRWLATTGAALIVLTIWVQLVQAFASRMKFGFSDIVFRQHSITGGSPAQATKVSQQQNARSLVLFLTGLVVTIVLGYAGAYKTLSHLCPSSFSVPLTGITGTVGCFYFSAVTFATVGYGDILPTSILARLLAVSEIFSSMACVVLLVLAYSMTGSDDGDA